MNNLSRTVFRYLGINISYYMILGKFIYISSVGIMNLKCFYKCYMKSSFNILSRLYCSLLFILMVLLSSSGISLLNMSPIYISNRNINYWSLLYALFNTPFIFRWYNIINDLYRLSIIMITYNFISTFILEYISFLLFR